MSAEYDYRLLKEYGKEVFISANVEIRRPHLVRLGSHIAIDTGFYCTVQADIGDYVHIGPYVTVIGGAEARLTMGEFTAMAAGCRIVCASDAVHGEGLNGMAPPEYHDRIINAPVVFERFSGIGTNVVVVPGVKLAEGSFVGACSLLTKNTEPWTCYFGCPAKPYRRRAKERMLAAARALGYPAQED